jgi:hypothetical protein
VIRNAARQLRRYIDSDSVDKSTVNRPPVPVLGVPYLTSKGIDTCREEGINCIDTAGNCLLRFGSIYIQVQGNSNPNPERRELKSLFSPKSSRVARVLLSDVGRAWGVREIAAEAGINPGLVSRLKKQLVQNAFVVENDRALIVNEPLALLNAWSDSYSFRRNDITEFYSFDSPQILEQKLARYCSSSDTPWALALFSGANHMAPHVHINKLFAYINDDIDEIATALGLKRVDSGANVMLLHPYDSGIFMDTTTIDDVPIASDIQLYLDLQSYRGRGVEAAEHLLEHIIQPRWEREATTRQAK